FRLAKTRLGINHPYTLGSLESLLGTYAAAGHHAEAENLLAEVLTPAIASHHESSGLLRVRAGYLARRGHWKEAAADWKRIIELRPEGAEDWHSLAAILVQSGELERYREHCRQSLERFANASDSVIAYRIAKDCLL